jgi:5-oxoprolinase (ATP-hydrolysing)
VSARGRWRIWIDTGGTFTDCLAVDPTGMLRRAKVLSSGTLRATAAAAADGAVLRLHESWGARADVVRGMELRVLGRGGDTARVAAYDPATGEARLDGAVRAEAGDACELAAGEEAPVLAARLVTGTPAGTPLPPLDMRLATTRGTNALLERRGARTAFFVTRGFGDLLLIGNQQRPDLFALAIRRSPPLYEVVEEVDARLAADGAVLRAPDPGALREAARRAVDAGARSAAVALMHAYRDPAQERAVRDVLLEAGFEHVSLSSELAPFLGLLPRAQTATVDAYLGPVIGRYLDGVRAHLGREGRLHVMTSAGGLVRPEAFRAKDSLLQRPGGRRGGRGAGGTPLRGSARDRLRHGRHQHRRRAVDGDVEYAGSTRWAARGIVAPRWPSRAWPRAAARSAPSTRRGCAWARRARAPPPARPATAPAGR